MLGLRFVRGLSLVAASGGHSSLRCAALSLSRPLLLRSTGSRHAGSVVVAHGPSCSAACGIFPDQGWNLCPLHWQADSQPLHHQGSPLDRLLEPVLNRTSWHRSALWNIRTSRDFGIRPDRGRTSNSASDPSLKNGWNWGLLSLRMCKHEIPWDRIPSSMLGSHSHSINVGFFPLQS